MARQIRKKGGTGICHVMLRDINRQDIFEDDDGYMQIKSGERIITSTDPVIQKLLFDGRKVTFCLVVED